MSPDAFKSLSAEELDAHVADARARFEWAYAEFERTGCPHDRTTAIQLKEVFEDACRVRRARAGDESFMALAEANLASNP